MGKDEDGGSDGWGWGLGRKGRSKTIFQEDDAGGSSDM